MKNKKSKIKLLVIMIATVFIVFSSVKIGLILANHVSDNETKSEKASLNKKEETKDYVINYIEETYKLQNNSDEIVVENRRSIPVLTSGKYPVAGNKIANYLKQASEGKWNELKAAADSYDKNSEKGMGVDFIISSIEQNDLYFSFKAITTGKIGESSWEEERVYSFDTKTGDLLTLKDIASDEDGLKQAIYKILVNTLTNKDYAKDLDDGWQKRVVKELNSQGNWYLSEDGINYVFAKYTFGPGHIGIIKHTIKYKDINNYLSNEYKKNA